MKKIAFILFSILFITLISLRLSDEPIASTSYTDNPGSAPAAIPTPGIAAMANATLPSESNSELKPKSVIHQQEPQLDRRLSESKPVLIEGQSWQVLGTRQVNQDNVNQTVLVLRDTASGQLDFYQSALRFVLKDGVDYETFISSRPNARRVFVNPLYGEIALDASYIAAEYQALSQDSRVLQVMFLPLENKPEAH